MAQSDNPAYFSIWSYSLILRLLLLLPPLSQNENCCRLALGFLRRGSLSSASLAWFLAISLLAKPASAPILTAVKNYVRDQEAQLRRVKDQDPVFAGAHPVA